MDFSRYLDTSEGIYVTKPSLPPFEEYVGYLKRIWDNNVLTNMGPLHKEFREKLAEFLGVPLCLPVCNGHMALEMTLQAMELSGEVITTPYTFASTTHAIVRNNLTPVFCDIRESDCTIDPDRIEELITDKTSAIVPVHVYGMPCDVEKIERIAQKHNLKVIYDAAHAFGVSVNGNSIASYGDASMFSFHATKIFNTIEGGCVVAKDEKRLLRVYQLHNFGIMDEENVDFVGANAKMNEFQAAMGLCNLKTYEEKLSKRRDLVELYADCLKDVPGIRMLKYDNDNIEYNYSYLPIFIDKERYGLSRNEVKELLAKYNIHARKYFYPITSDFNCYDYGKDKSRLGIARKMSEQVLTLPLYPDLAKETVINICNILREKK